MGTVTMDPTSGGETKTNSLESVDPAADMRELSKIMKESVNWELQDEIYEGMSVRRSTRKEPPKVYHCIRVDGVVAVSPGHAFAVLSDVARRPAIDKQCSKSVVLNELDGCQLAHMGFRCINNVKGRDMCLRLHGAAMEGGVYMLYFSSVDDTVERFANYQRTDVLASGYILSPILGDPDSCVITSILQVDLRGWIPAWLVKSVCWAQAVVMGRVGKASSPLTPSKSPLPLVNRRDSGIKQQDTEADKDTRRGLFLSGEMSDAREVLGNGVHMEAVPTAVLDKDRRVSDATEDEEFFDCEVPDSPEFSSLRRDGSLNGSLVRGKSFTLTAPSADEHVSLPGLEVGGASGKGHVETNHDMVDAYQVPLGYGMKMSVAIHKGGATGTAGLHSYTNALEGRPMNPKRVMSTPTRGKKQGRSITFSEHVSTHELSSPEAEKPINGTPSSKRALVSAPSGAADASTNRRILQKLEHVEQHMMTATAKTVANEEKIKSSGWFTWTTAAVVGLTAVTTAVATAAIMRAVANRSNR